MIDRLTPDFASDAEAVDWMVDPERHVTSWQHEGTLGAVDDLLAIHGLEIVLETFQGEPYVSIAARPCGRIDQA